MKPEHNPFLMHADWQNNACITNYMQFSELSRLYMQSGDTLIDFSLENSSTMDVHVYAICFLYRHSIELLLKDLLWRSSYAVNGRREFCKHHRLPDLWGDLCAVIGSLSRVDTRLSSDKERAIKEFLEEINKHDPGSDGFRYPVDKNMRRSHQKLTHVNLRLLKERFHILADDICIIYEIIEQDYDMRVEYEANQ